MLKIAILNALYAAILLFAGSFSGAFSLELLYAVAILALCSTALLSATAKGMPRIGMWEVLISHTQSIMLLILIAYLAIYFHLSFGLVLAVCLTGLAFAGFLRLRASPVRVELIARPFSFDWKILLVGAIYVGPLLFVDYWMGAGRFSHVFFGPDTPFYLSQIFELIRDPQLPPQSLWIGGERIPYHYGFQAAIAALCRSTGLAPHHALFLLAAPILHLGLVAAAYQLTLRLARSYPRWLVFSLAIWGVVIASSSWNGVVNSIAILMSVASVTKPVFFSSFFYQYEMFNTYLAVFFVISSFLFLLNSNVDRAKVSPVFSPLLLIIKPQAFFVVVPGVGLSFLYRFIGRRNFIAATLFVLISVLTLLMVFSINNQKSPGLLWSPLQFWRTEWRTMGQELLIFAFVFLFWALHRNLRLMIKLLPTVGALVVAYLFVTLFTIRSGLPDDSNILQVLRYTPVLLALALVVIGNFHRNLFLARPIKYFLAAIMMAASLSRMMLVLAFAIQPQWWHGYVNNDSLEAVLRAVPTKNAIFIVNDIRYPSENYLRPQRQVQYAAIYGQEFYLSDPFDAIAFGYSDVVKERQKIYDLLQLPNWSNKLDERLKKNPDITHLLIHKNWHYPASIPYQKVIENGDYIIYDLRRKAAG